MSKQTKKKKENSKIKDFFRVIISAYSREKDDDNEYTDKTFSLLSSLLFYIIGYGMLIFEVLLIVGFSNYYINTFNWSNIIKGIIAIKIPYTTNLSFLVYTQKKATANFKKDSIIPTIA